MKDVNAGGEQRRNEKQKGGGTPSKRRITTAKEEKASRCGRFGRVHWSSSNIIREGIISDLWERGFSGKVRMEDRLREVKEIVKL